MIFQLDAAGGPMTEAAVDFTDDAFAFSRSGQDWELMLMESGTLRLNAMPGLVDIFLVADGANGGTGRQVGAYYYSGKGGDGGRYLAASGVRLQRGTAYAVTIGAVSGIAGGDVTLATDGEASQAGAAGGRAAYVGPNDPNTANEAGGPGIYAYGEEQDTLLIESMRGKRFCAGGGGGDCSVSGTHSSAHGGVNEGGATDGGDGGSSSSGGVSAAGAGGENTGSGGGGGYSHSTYGVAAGAAGGSGVVFIRKHRETAG